MKTLGPCDIDLSRLNPTPHAIAVYASSPLSPVATQHSLPSGRYPLLGPDFHRPDRTSLRLAHVAVGTCVSSHAPRTEPYVRLSRIRLPPWVCDGKAVARPRMEDDRFWETAIHKLRHPCPRDPSLLAATSQRAPPGISDVMPEHLQCTTVGRHCVVIEVAADDSPQPLPLRGDRLVHAPSHLLLHFLELRPHAVPSGLPFDLEFSRSGLAADEGETQEVEGLRFAESAPLAAFRRKAPELDDPGLLGIQRQRKLLQPITHLVQEAPGIVLMLETDDEIVGIAHDDHITRGLAPSPACGPEVEGIVQVDVGKQRRDHRTLPGPPVTNRQDLLF